MVEFLEGHKDQKCQDCLEQEMVQDEHLVQEYLEQEMVQDEQVLKDCLEYIVGYD